MIEFCLVKNKTTVLILVFKEFLQTSIPPLISVLHAKGYHYFPLKNFRLTVPKNFVEEPFFVSQNFWYRKNLWIRGGGEYHEFPSKFLSHCTKIFHWRTLWCFRKILLSKSFMHRRGAAWFCQNFLSHRTEKTSPGNHSVFQKISDRAKYFMDKRGGGYHEFPSKFLSHCTKIFHWRTLWCFRKILLSKSFMHRRGAAWFCQNFLSHRTETKSFVKEPFFFPEVFWYRKKFMDKRGHITIFYRKFVSQYRKTS